MAERVGEELVANGGAWGSLLGAWLMGLFAATMQIMPASVFPLVMADLGIGPSAASLLVSSMFVPLIVLSVPVGYGIDRFDDGHVLAVGTGLLVAGGVWSWWAATNGRFLPLLAARIFAGVGMVALWNAGANVAGSVFPEERAATALAVFTTSAPTGFAFGQFATPMVAGVVGWEATFLASAGLSASALGVFAVAWRHVEPVGESAGTPALADFRRVFERRAVWVVASMSFVAYSLHLFFNSWIPTFLTDSVGLGLAASGTLAAVFPAMGVLSRITGGILSDRVFDRRRRPIPLVSFAVAVPVIVLVATVTTPALLVVLLVAAGFFIQLGIGLFYTHVQELVPPTVGGSAIALLSSMSFLGGFTSPVIAGALIDRTGAYLPAFGYALVLAVIGVGLAWIVPEPRPRSDGNR